jgi:hypothetical protein
MLRIFDWDGAGIGDKPIDSHTPVIENRYKL